MSKSVPAFRRIDRLASHVADRWSSWKNDRESLESKWEFWYRMYRTSEEPGDKSTIGETTREMERSQVKMPATKEAVNIFLDSAMQIIFASEDFFDLFPRSLMAQERAVLVKKYLRYLFDQERISEKIEAALSMMSIYGWCVAKVEPKITIKQRSVRVERTDEAGKPLGVRDVTVEETTIFRPNLRVPHVENFVVNSTATSVDDAEGCIERSVVFFSDVQDMARKGLVDEASLSSLKAKGKESDRDGETLSSELEERLSRSGIYPAQDVNDQVELLDWWGFIPQVILDEAGLGELGDNGGAEMHVLVAGGHTTLKATLNPYATKKRPFLTCTFEPLPGEFYGMGICEAAEGPQRALDATIRSRIDNKALSINQIFGINVNKMVPGQNLKLYPGKSFLFNGPPGESLQPMAIPDVTQGSYVEAQEFERYIQHATGISRIMGGMPSKSGEQTAHEVQTLASRASGRIRRIVKRFESSVIQPMVTWYYQLLLETLNVGEVFRVTGDNGATELLSITPDQIEGDYDFVAQGSIAMANQARMQKLMQFMAQAANPILGNFVNWPYLLKKVYDGMGFVDAEQALMLQPPPMMPGGLPNVGTQPAPGRAMGPTPQPGGAVGTPGPAMDFGGEM